MSRGNNFDADLPDLPVGLNDRDYNLVAPLYRAIYALKSQQTATGAVTGLPEAAKKHIHFQAEIDINPSVIYLRSAVGSTSWLELLWKLVTDSSVFSTFRVQPATQLLKDSVIAGSVVGFERNPSQTLRARDKIIPVDQWYQEYVIGNLPTLRVASSAHTVPVGIALAVPKITSRSLPLGNITISSPEGTWTRPATIPEVEVAVQVSGLYKLPGTEQPIPIAVSDPQLGKYLHIQPDGTHVISDSHVGGGAYRVGVMVNDSYCLLQQPFV